LRRGSRKSFGGLLSLQAMHGQTSDEVLELVIQSPKQFKWLTVTGTVFSIYAVCVFVGSFPWCLYLLIPFLAVEGFFFSRFVMSLRIDRSLLTISTPFRKYEYALDSLSDLRVKKGWGGSVLDIQVKLNGSSDYVTFILDMLKIRNEAPINIRKELESSFDELRPFLGKTSALTRASTRPK
jgi:hypothetical protein